MTARSRRRMPKRSRTAMNQLLESQSPIRHHNELPDLCTPEEVRRFLRIGRNTVYDLIKSGALPCVRFGKLIRIPKTALLPPQGRLRNS